MRETVKDRGRLEHILDAVNMIIANKEKYTLESIKNDSIAFYGFAKLVEIIGEAVYMLTKEYREAHKDINWRIIEKMRHVLVHGYYTINPDDLWQTVEEDIPALKPQIERLLNEMDDKQEQQTNDSRK